MPRLVDLGIGIAEKGAGQQGFNSSCCLSSHAPAEAGVPAFATVNDNRLT